MKEQNRLMHIFSEFRIHLRNLWTVDGNKDPDTRRFPINVYRCYC